MKRFLLVIPIILLILLNACGSGAPVAPPTATLTVTVGPSPTFDPRTSDLFNYLNFEIETMEVADKYTELEHITGASYQVINVGLLEGDTILHLDVRCECAANAQCCSPTRTFVVTIMAMDVQYNPSDPILGMVPNTITLMELATFEHANPGAVVRVPWDRVRRYLMEELTGFQLAADVDIR